ncbi:hypothetical protein SAMN05216249_102223 [Acetitomaculum ruminis DSM 5522]|uniref:Uncharacterized protein n=1 Tax=Acetitomaculum ruminis DSM 5522 TaxID=1120918 RepID=A0A1I0VV85_9FIRM|nr:hypothetical protein [Acetitomaculum ruminis]SFA80359.1 hypothetical protein SAMN05216249_102223 [Acetitomaculum ruminis DSM 5522]
MKKVKRIGAISLIVVLLALYVSCIIFALIGSELAINLLKISIYSTIVLPVLLYLCMMFIKMGKNRNNLLNDAIKTNSQSNEKSDKKNNNGE